MSHLCLLSYAKINLGLRLLRKREDGYHDIATVFQQIDLHDRITFQRTRGPIRITSSHPGLPLTEENLIHRAFTLFQETLGIRGGLEAHVHKQIPVGAGLGGGSSNAAVTLTAANRLWGTKLRPDDLAKIAAQIGSDVPFFLRGGTALGQGRGEILAPLVWLTDYWVVLVYSGIHVSTTWAYRQAKINLTKEEKFTKFRAIFEKKPVHALRKTLKNDLEGVVFRRHPVLRELKEKMYKRDAFYASMSGSGSSVYGLFFHQEDAEKAVNFFSAEEGITVFLCRPM